MMTTNMDQLTREYQSHSGAVVPQTPTPTPSVTPSVQYFYAGPSSTQNYSRLSGTQYPDGRIVDDVYSTGQVPITSITHSGATATVATTVNHGLSTGNTVIISGASDPLYDGTFTVTVTDSTHFTYTMTSSPAANASGSDMTVAKPSLDNSISRVSALQEHSTNSTLGTTAGQLLQSYLYLGPSTLVQEADANGVSLSYFSPTPTPTPSDTGDEYTGLDRFNRIVEQKYATTTPTPTTKDDFQYAYDRDGNPLYKNNLLSSTNSELYHANSTATGDNNSAYDLLNRLTAFRRGTLSASGNNGASGTRGADDTVTTASPAEGWNLDAVGNWACLTTNGTPTSRSHDKRNELTAVGAASLAYDHNGNMTTDQIGNTLAYDAWNEPVKYTWLCTCGCGTTAGSAETFQNDALGRRVADAYSQPPTFSSCVCNFDTSDSFYYSEQGQVLQDDGTSITYNPNACGCICGCGCGTWCGCSCDCATTTQTFVWGAGYVNDLVLRDREGSTTHTDAGGSGDTTTTTITPQRLYAQHDANYNVTALVDSSGNVLQRFIYDPYGTRTARTAAWGTANDSYGWQVGFQGMWLDTDTLLYHALFRDYSPVLGRWIQQDPAGYINGSNTYGFIGDDPSSAVDPSGLEWSVKRAGGARAAAVNSCATDNVTNLATRVHLDPKYYTRWLVATDGKPLPASPTDPVGAGRTFSVPNTVFVGVGVLGFLPRVLISGLVSHVISTCKDAGFSVIYGDNQIPSWRLSRNGGIRWGMKTVQGIGSDLYGLIVFGHGQEPHLSPQVKGQVDINDDGTDYLGPYDLSPHQLGFLIVDACFADLANWDYAVAPRPDLLDPNTGTTVVDTRPNKYISSGLSVAGVDSNLADRIINGAK